MAKSNRDRIGEALDVLKNGLQPFMTQELKRRYGDDWASKATSELRFKGEDGNWDVSLLLNVLCNQWQAVFRDVLGNTDRTLAFELRDVRNSWAHQKSFSYDDTYRALDSMARLLRSVNAGDPAAELDKQKQEVLRVQFTEQTRTESRKAARAAETSGTPAAGLTPWRDVIEPHEDVASGNYLNAEFAADLHQVFTKRATPEYGDPIEFFRRTYLTEGLSDLLVNSVKRLTGKGGDPVVALQTNFGGGKTHSMLALYHLFGGVKGGDLAGVDELLSGIAVEKLPTVKRAVLVGHYLMAGEAQKMPDGTMVRTLWGELAWQLAGKAGYKLVKEADETSTNPGKRLIELFQLAGPSLILIDEWVSYARQLYEKHDLPGGSFDTQFTFAQALTEAAAAAKNVFLVVSVPSSDIEVGGTAGREALNRLENVVSRVQATWQPASTDEGFEIVRRRLFKSISDADLFRKRDAVIRAFIDNYRANSKEFPSECSSAEYEKRMRSAYPIHPDVFDRLYGEWSTLDRFQRTRGVLRMMAAVIHELWERQDRNLMILPGMIPMDEPSVLKELKGYLSPEWSAILEKDVDGVQSTPLEIDRGNNTLGRYSATRRVARTIFLGTAPLVGAANRGKDIRQIHIGVVQPGESLATFGDALRRLQNQATYLQTDGERTFYDTAQNINREAESRKAGLDEEDVIDEIRGHLKGQERDRGDFSAIHAAPSSPSDVADDYGVRLVILGPEHTHTSGKTDSGAITQAKQYLDSRGAGPRLKKNTLVFLAPDKVRLADLVDAVRWSMAWRDIDDQRAHLDLNRSQIMTVEAKRREWDTTVSQRLTESFCWLLVPTQEDHKTNMTIEAMRLSGDGSLADRSAKKLKPDHLYTEFGGVALRMEVDRVPLWRGDDKDHVSLQQLLDDFAQYTYLPRLASPQVLIKAIVNGVGLITWRSDTFAYAEARDDKGYYAGLRAGENIQLTKDSAGYLVKADIAAAQIDRATEPKPGLPTTEPGPISNPTDSTSSTDTTTVPASDAIRRFYGTVSLDPTRTARDAGKIAEEILAHLVSKPGAQITVKLDIEADFPDSLDESTRRTVSENCRVLGFDSHGFENK